MYSSHLGDLNVSYELSESASLPTPDTGDCILVSPEEKAVMSWLQKYAPLIINAEKTWHIDRRAIAGAIAWEALKNVQHHFSPQSTGAGKVHANNVFPPFYTLADEVERLGYLPPKTSGQMMDITAEPEGAIKYHLCYYEGYIRCIYHGLSHAPRKSECPQ